MKPVNSQLPIPNFQTSPLGGSQWALRVRRSIPNVQFPTSKRAPLGVGRWGLGVQGETGQFPTSNSQLPNERRWELSVGRWELGVGG